MSHQENAPISITPGAIRFNTDSMKLEYFRIGMEGGSTSSYAGIGTLAAGEWVQITTDTPDIQTGGTRGLFMGGFNEPSPNTTYDVIDYVNIATTGNAADFGNLVGADGEGNSFASRTRGFFFGGDPAKTNIETFVISSTGNATAFGNLTANSKTGIGVANSTRGIAALCTNPASTDVINYITMASTGSGVDFGNNTTNAVANGAGCQSPTRGIFAGGAGSINTIGFITISTLGDTADFGDLTQGRFGHAGASNAVRGLFSGGANPGGVNTIDYITIATLGNAADFGDLNTAGVHYTAGCSSSTRAIRGGGADNAAPAGNYSNAIDYVQIMSTGNAVDFGDRTVPARHLDACSNGHGGL